jgi:hypothetical protein
MKCSNLQKILFFLTVLLSMSLITYAKTANIYATNMYDSVVAGDTAIIRVDPGFFDADKLFGELRSWDHQPVDLCPECTDTIWSYMTELYQDSIFDFYFAIPLGTYPGQYSLFVHYENNGNVIREYMFIIEIVSPPYIYRQPEDVIACQGDSAEFGIGLLIGGCPGETYKWYHNSILYPKLTWRTLGIANVQFQDTGFYYCIVSNCFGTDTTDIVRLDLEKMPLNTGAPEGPDRFCPGSGITGYAINSDPYTISYTWHLLPAEAGILESLDTSAQVEWEPGYNGVAGIFVKLTGGSCGEVFTDTLKITIPGPKESPGICIVGIDEETGKYRIVWEKSGYEDAQLYDIYRESNQADVYFNIGSVEPDELSVFVDLSSAPDILSHRYKISYIDSCGNESELSAFHQTMHLSANMSISNDVNLIWSEYKGIAFPAYEIYRGNQPNSMELLTQVPSTVTAYKDSDPPLGIIWYQIVMSNPAGCNPEKKAGMDFSSSRSNMEQVQNTSIPEVTFENKPFIMYPNPAEKVLYFRFSKTYTDPLYYKIYNSTGINVLEGLIHSGNNSIDISSLSSGIFVMELWDENDVFKTRFVCNH